VGLQWRRTVRLGKGRRLNLSKSGVSVSKKQGPITLNSRGRVSIRLARGLSWRFKL
jgi:uncharacterized protein DUF4236